MKFEEIIKLISAQFTAAWNQWDIASMSGLLSDNVVIHSPKISYVYPENTEGVIRGKDRLIEYWSKLKKMTNNYKVDQISIEKVGREVRTINKVVGEEITIKEIFIVNEYGKIEYLKYEYESN